MQKVTIKATSEYDARYQLEKHLEALNNTVRSGSLSYGKVERLKVDKNTGCFLTVIRITYPKLSGQRDSKIWLEAIYDIATESVPKSTRKQTSEQS